MRLSKLLFVLIFLTLVTFECNILLTASTGALSPHIHEYIQQVIEPSCTSPGCAVYECKCGDSYSEEIPPTGHLYEEVEYSNPTCTVPGERVFVCSKCNDRVSEALPALGHSSFVTETQPSTCTEKGTSVCTCGVCGEIIFSEEYQPLGHNYTSVTVEPTCISAGYTLYKCSSCGDTYTDNEISPLEHTFDIVGEYKEPTCSKDGYRIFYCKCGESQKSSVPATGKHDYRAEVTKEPTYESTGIKKISCSVCGHSYTEQISALKRPKVNLAARTPYDAKNVLSANARSALDMIFAEYSSRISKGNENDFLLPLPFELSNEEVNSIVTYLTTELGGLRSGSWLISKVEVGSNSLLGYYFIGDEKIELSSFKEHGGILVNTDILKKHLAECDEIQRWIKGIVSNFTEGDDLHMITQIFDYMKTNFRYNPNEAWLPDLKSAKNGSCNALSLFTAQCCRLLGIRCDVVIGFTDDGGYHAWNIVSVNGKPTFWDATFKIRNSSKPLFHGKILNDTYLGANKLRDYPDMKFPTSY